MATSRSTSAARGALGIAVAGLVVLSVALIARGRLPGDAGEQRGTPGPSAPSAPATPPAEPPSALPSVTASAAPASLPLGLVDKTWITLDSVGYGGPYVAGTLDGRYHLALPIGERGLAAADGRVASVLYGPGGATGSSTLLVRDLRKAAAKLVELPWPDAISYAVLTGDTVYFAPNSAPNQVPGVYAASLADGSVRTVIEPASFPGDLGEGTGRGPLVLSPTGTTLSSGVCNSGRCNIQVLDLATGRLSQPLTDVPSFLWLASDTVLITVDEASVYGYDMAGGRRWTLTGVRPQGGSGYLTSDAGRLIVLYQDVNPGSDGAIALASVDVSSGAQRVLLRWPKDVAAPWLWVLASGDQAAVLIPGGAAPEDAFSAGGGSFRVDVVDLTTGALSPAALIVSAR